jgi:dTDP-glucose 4,6-dehydratase
VPDRPGHDRRYALDGSRLQALGWACRVPFGEGIARTVEWYSKNEAWWRPLRDTDWEDYYARQYGWRLEHSQQA